MAQPESWCLGHCPPAVARLASCRPEHMEIGTPCCAAKPCLCSTLTRYDPTTSIRKRLPWYLKLKKQPVEAASRQLKLPSRNRSTQMGHGNTAATVHVETTSAVFRVVSKPGLGVSTHTSSDGRTGNSTARVPKKTRHIVETDSFRDITSFNLAARLLTDRRWVITPTGSQHCRTELRHCSSQTDVISIPLHSCGARSGFPRSEINRDVGKFLDSVTSLLDDLVYGFFI